MPGIAGSGMQEWQRVPESEGGRAEGGEAKGRSGG